MVYAISFVLGLVSGFAAFYGASLYFCLRVMRRENLEAVIGILLKDKAERKLGMSFEDAVQAEEAFRKLKDGGWSEITA